MNLVFMIAYFLTQSLRNKTITIFKEVITNSFPFLSRNIENGQKYNFENELFIHFVNKRKV